MRLRITAVLCLLSASLAAFAAPKRGFLEPGHVPE